MLVELCSYELQSRCDMRRCGASHTHGGSRGLFRSPSLSKQTAHEEAVVEMYLGGARVFFKGSGCRV